MHLLPLLSGVLAVTTQVSARSVPQLFARHTEGDCTPQPLGSGPVPSTDTPQAFLSDSDFDNAANNAQTPDGYSLVYKDQKASSNSDNYLGYDLLTNYDPEFCAESCESNWAGCVAFNIYFERDPTLDPGVNCTNPPSTTNIKCAYFGSPLYVNSTTNTGQQCADFQIVIAGSNGYNLTPPQSQCTAGSRTINGRTCSVTCGVDRPGGDYGNAYEPNFEACIQACATDPKCVTAQYHEDTQYCYFKNVSNTAVSAAGEDTVDCSGSPYTTTTTNTVGAATTSTTTTTFKAGTTTTTTTAATTTSTSAPQCTAGSSLINGRTCTTSCNTDRPGGDYGNAYEPSLAACAQACAADPKCVTAQYHEDSKYCYFKSVSNSAVLAPGVDTVDCSSSPSSTTTGPAATTTTTSKAGSTTTVASTTTTSKAASTTTTTAAVTTTAKASTTTTTTKSTTTTTTVAPTGTCFRMYAQGGPGFITGDQLSLDQQSRLSHTADKYDTIFTIDKYGALRSATNKGALIYRSTECKKHSHFGYVTTKAQGGWWVTCNKGKLAGKQGTLTCGLYGSDKAQSFYTTASDGEVVFGSAMPMQSDGKPWNNKNDWQTFGVVYQPATCPSGGEWLNW